MELEELEIQEPCAACGALVVEGLSPSYNFGMGEVLCWECAIRRGGKYDAEHDTWSEAPNTSDLPDDRRSPP
jgi:hypothetical protein